MYVYICSYIYRMTDIISLEKIDLTNFQGCQEKNKFSPALFYFYFLFFAQIIEMKVWHIYTHMHMYM